MKNFCTIPFHDTAEKKKKLEKKTSKEITVGQSAAKSQLEQKINKKASISLLNSNFTF